MEAAQQALVHASMEAARRQLEPSSHPPTGRNSAIQAILREVTDGARHHPGLWLGGAALVGFALARVIAGRRTPEVVRVAARAGGASLLATSLRAGYEWARPHLAELGKRKLAEFLQSRHNENRPAESPPSASASGPSAPTL